MQNGFSKIIIPGNSHRQEEDRKAWIWVPRGEGPWPLLCICSGNMEEKLAELVKEEGKPQYIIFAPDAQWERDYTPWQSSASALPGRSAFLGNAGEYLNYLTEDALPFLESELPICADAGSRAIMGYSLGGLFALWAGYTTDRFGCAASLSGSLWYEGWLDFAEKHSPVLGTSIYLSLGKSEEHSGNEIMRRVGDCTRQTCELLKQQLGEDQVMLEWNRGGHFTGMNNRWRKAISWWTGRCK